jgi:hypothetical protein
MDGEGREVAAVTRGMKEGRSGPYDFSLKKYIWERQLLQLSLQVKSNKLWQQIEERHELAWSRVWSAG